MQVWASMFDSVPRQVGNGPLGLGGTTVLVSGCACWCFWLCGGWAVFVAGAFAPPVLAHIRKGGKSVVPAALPACPAPRAGAV